MTDSCHSSSFLPFFLSSFLQFFKLPPFLRLLEILLCAVRSALLFRDQSQDPATLGPCGPVVPGFATGLNGKFLERGRGRES